MQEGIYDQFLKVFTAVAADLATKTGDPFVAGNEHGPQVSKLQFDVCPPSIPVAYLTGFSSARHELH